jgi:cytochrome c oxidase cbb3-type subunit III
VDLQQRMLFPVPARGRGAGGRGGGAVVTVTVAPRAGQPRSGTLLQMDDFYVTLRDASDVTHVVKRSPDVKVTVNDPLQAHHELLDRITDKQMHDLTAYLVTLK